jgi:hypothetical protein
MCPAAFSIRAPRHGRVDGYMGAADQFAEVLIRRYDNAPECVVVVAFRGRQSLLRCRDYDQAVKWARVECRSYGIASVTVEHID